MVEQQWMREAVSKLIGQYAEQPLQRTGMLSKVKSETPTSDDAGRKLPTAVTCCAGTVNKLLRRQRSSFGHSRYADSIFCRKLLPERACHTRLAGVKQELKAAADQDQVPMTCVCTCFKDAKCWHDRVSSMRTFTMSAVRCYVVWQVVACHLRKQKT